MHQGVVKKSTGSWYEVITDSGDAVSCTIRGKIRLKGMRTTNPVAVGDEVVFERNEDGTGVITRIKPRRNYIVRKSVNLSHDAHILAANIDQAMLFVTLKEPPTLPAFIDRFLVTAEAYHIPAVLIFNKKDVYNIDELEVMRNFADIYRSIGYTCLEVSALLGSGIEEVKKLLESKATLLSGHSGAGKSTLINAIDPSLNLKTSAISKAHLTGQHTTTFAEMFPLSFGGYVIDTPGIKGFGLVDFEKSEIAQRFPEMRALMHLCKFNNCLHLDEPQCAVKKAVEEGRIAMSRYESYLSLCDPDGDDNHYRKSIYG
jgi:ribosome biogenesis GTPase